MSYDAYILIDSGGDELAEIEDIGNYTSNISPMYQRVLPGPYIGGGKYRGIGESEPRGGLPGLSGLPCIEAARFLRLGIAQLQARESEMRELEPDNGGGDYGGALHYLINIEVACLRHPKAILAVSW